MLKLTASDNRYALVRPVTILPRVDILYLADDIEDFGRYVTDIPATEEAVIVDLETKGTVAAHPDFRIVTVGLGCSIGSIALDVSGMDKAAILLVLKSIIHLPLMAHNLYFDASGFAAYGVPFESVKWHGCTYVLYKSLASEGLLGQQHGLKAAQRDMLGWEHTNEEGIDEWLVSNGYVTDLSKLSTLTSPELRIARYNERDKKGNRKLHPDKGEMWRTPFSILGPYCALDCESTWLLYTHVLKPALQRIPPQTWEMHQEGFLPLIGILIDNHFSGLTVDTVKLSAYNDELMAQIAILKKEFREHHQLADHIRGVEEQWVAEIPVPSPFKKDGKPSKLYANYLSKIEEIKAGTNPKLNKDFHFNVNGNEMRELLYGVLVQTEITRPHEGADSTGKFKITGGPEGTNVGIELDMTDSGQLPMDEAAFNQMGEIGKLLVNLSTMEKLQTYVSSGLLKTTECGTGLAHPQYRLYGTLTGRLAGGGDSEYKVNYQQLPSDRKYLECYIARKGYVLVQADVSALEPHVLAEFSRDKTYMELYGPDAKEQDIYLFNGSKITRFRDKIMKAGYEAGNKEAIERCKKECKAERTILKKVSLAKAYGAGAYKIWTGLRLDGVDITQREVEQIVADFDGPNLYGGVKRFAQELEREWRDNKGWVLGALGTAIPLAEKLKKDLINRVIQTSGHQILILFLGQFLRPMLIEAGVDFKWYIPDLHDETIYEVREDQAALALSVHCAAVQELNKMLDGVTTIKMHPKTIGSLAERKDD